MVLIGVLGIATFSYMKSSSENINFPSSKINTSVSHEKSPLNFQSLKDAISNAIKAAKHTSNPSLNSSQKFAPSIKLNHYQAIAYQKTSPRESRLLHEILSNKKKRNKFEYVMKIAEKLKLPKDLALIPVIESEYQNKAVSNKGAGGLWQLMPGTAKIFGLSKKQRFDTAASTRAALLHFKDLHNEYKNWELAIAAYNAGDGTVNKALKKDKNAKTVQDLKLPLETRNYVLAFFQLQHALKSYNIS